MEIMRKLALKQTLQWLPLKTDGSHYRSLHYFYRCALGLEFKKNFLAVGLGELGK